MFSSSMPSNPRRFIPGVNSTSFHPLLHFGHFFFASDEFIFPRTLFSSNVNDAKRHQIFFSRFFFRECLIGCTGHNEKRRRDREKRVDDRWTVEKKQQLNCTRAAFYRSLFIWFLSIGRGMRGFNLN